MSHILALTLCGAWPLESINMYRFFSLAAFSTKDDTVGEPCFQSDASSRADNTNSSSELTFDPSEGFANSIKMMENRLLGLCLFWKMEEGVSFFDKTLLNSLFESKHLWSATNICIIILEYG
jgi:hypothetical protein